MRKLALVLLFVAAGTGIAAGNAEAASPSAPTETPKHAVAAGESLSSIATDNKLSTWLPIWSANPNLANPDQISPGDQLVVPDPAQAVADRPLPPGYGAPTPVVAAATTTVAPSYSQRPAAQASPAPSGDLRTRVCMRESGCNYATNTGNGYSGAYQYDDRTWGGYAGYSHAYQAPPAVQDQKFAETYAARGCSPWPNTCR